MTRVPALVVYLVVAGACGCARSHPPASATKSTAPPSPPTQLSSLGLFDGPMAQQRPAAGVIHYELSTPLFSDYTTKDRFIRLPANSPARYQQPGVIEFPIGTIIAKTFSMPTDQREPHRGRKLIETRILQRTADGWHGWPYVWNDEQSDAFLSVAGDIRPVSWIHFDGSARENGHLVPNTNQCKGCHEQAGVMSPLGPQVVFLNHRVETQSGRVNQLEAWVRSERLQGAPANERWPQAPAWNDAEADLNARARAWLDVNCAHCHNPNGPARNAGLDYRLTQADPAKIGIWKAPVAAGRGTGGRQFDIVPGKPDESILTYRLESTEPGIAMPELGRRLVDHEGLQLIRAWIAAMPPDPPPAPKSAPAGSGQAQPGSAAR